MDREYTYNWCLLSLPLTTRAFRLQVPNYGLPPALEKVDILRVVVREK